MNEEKRVLIVDDEEAVLYAYQRLFGSPKTGLIVDTAANIDQAKVLLGQHRYKMVVTDLRLDTEDHWGGFNLARTIKAMDPDIKIILVTAYGSSSIRENALGCGADYYLEKPVQLDNLREILNSIH